MNFDTAGILEGAYDFGIAREWVQSACRNYNSVPVNCFGQWFMVACTLAFDFDRENAPHFVPRTSLYGSTSEEGNSIVQDFVVFLTSKDHLSLTCGSSYLRYVRRGARVHVYLF